MAKQKTMEKEKGLLDLVTEAAVYTWISVASDVVGFYRICKVLNVIGRVNDIIELGVENTDEVVNCISEKIGDEMENAIYEAKNKVVELIENENMHELVWSTDENLVKLYYLYLRIKQCTKNNELLRMVVEETEQECDKMLDVIKAGLSNGNE